MKYRPCPGNSPGPFYVVDNGCLMCQAPLAEAPDLMDAQGEPGYTHHCRFHRQPATEAELDRAIDAVRVCCTEAVRYAGNDKEILDRIGYRSQCDVLLRVEESNPWFPLR